MKALHRFDFRTVSLLVASVMLVIVGATMSSCVIIRDDHDNWRDDSDNVDNTHYSASEPIYYASVAGSRTALNVNAINGPVTIQGEAGLDSIIITGVRRVESESTQDARDHLPDLLLILDPNSSSTFTVRTEQPHETHGRNYVVEYSIRIPLAWQVTVANINGDVTLDSLGGNAVVSEQCGSVHLWDVLANTDAQVTAGMIECRTVLSGTHRCALQTVTGDVHLWIPENTSADLSASVVIGSITLQGLTLHDSQVTPTHVHGTLGNGEGTIALVATTGAITVTGF
jgi:hypothetical protein